MPARSKPRVIELFASGPHTPQGVPCCAEAARQVLVALGSPCELIVHDLGTKAGKARAAKLGISAAPSSASWMEGEPGGPRPRRPAAIPIERARAQLLTRALAYPGARIATVNGEQVAQAKGRVFAYLGVAARPGLSVAFSLPTSRGAALQLPGAAEKYSTGDWIQLDVPPDTRPPLALLSKWLEESYRAVVAKGRGR
jgi:hypothetical protein